MNAPWPNTERQDLGRCRAVFDAASESAETALRRLPAGVFAFGGSLACIAVSVGFFSPKFWLLRHPIPGTFEWSRALTFLQQSAAPFDLEHVAEPAMRWRILPALGAHLLHLGNAGAWLVPGAGLIVLLAYLIRILASQTADRLTALLGATLIATTGGVITVTNFLGINDAWFVLGLAIVTCGRSSAALAAAGLLCPWVDERFLIALPLAFACRMLVTMRCFAWRDLIALLPGSSAYVLVRLTALGSGHEAASAEYVHSMLRVLPVELPYIPLGWWMGFRLGWALVLLPIALLWATRRHGAAIVLAALGFAALATITVLASDFTRSTILLLPLALAGITAVAGAWTCTASRAWAAALLAGNLVLPFVWVTYTKLWIILPLPIELARSWKNWHTF